MDDAHPELGIFGFEQQQKRMGPAVGMALVAHLVIATVLLILIRLAPKPDFTPVPNKPETQLVYLQSPGPGGGGGGGGEQAPKPARKAQLPGKDKLAVPVAPPPPKKAEPKPKKEDPPQRVDIPVQTVMAGLQQLPGIIRNAPSDETSAGSGTNGGAGSGSGAGLGEGKGSGLGPGTGGGTGGGVYRPGNGVDLPRVLQEVRPQYTSDAMRAKIQGTVWLECVVEPDGSVGNVRVVRSLDQTYGLDQEAIKAARQWRFAPGTKDGHPVPVLVTIELTFTLR